MDCLVVEHLADGLLVDHQLLEVALGGLLIEALS